MCKKLCPCDPRGLSAMAKWSPEQISRLSNNDIYFFNGWYTTYYECYQDLVKNNFIQSENEINVKTLMFI